MAVLKLSYINELQINQLELWANTIRDFISSSLHRYLLLQKQQIIDDLIKNYQKRGQEKNIANIFEPIIDIIRTKYCICDGASFLCGILI